MLKNKVALSLAFALYSVSGFAQDWKSVADSQLELQVLLLAKEKAELEKKTREALEPEKPVNQPGPPQAGMAIEPAFNPMSGSMVGMPMAAPGGMPPEVQTPMNEKIRLISIYGADMKNLNADILYDEEVITVSRDGTRGVDKFYGWEVQSIDNRQVVFTKLAKEDDKDKTYTRTFVLRRAAMTPLVSSSAANPAPSFVPAPPTFGDSQLRANGGRFGIPRPQGAQVPPAVNVNSARPGQPVPPGVLQPAAPRAQ